MSAAEQQRMHKYALTTHIDLFLTTKDAATMYRAKVRTFMRRVSTQRPVQYTPPVEMTEAHVSAISTKDSAMRAAYDSVRDNFPATSQADVGIIDRDAAVRKRLLYRSKQRGWLEVDLLMGGWADAHLASLNAVELAQYERVLGSETLDLYNYVTGKAETPEHLKDCADIMSRLQHWAKNSKRNSLSTPEGYASVKGIYSN